jgi:hypothetical protein
METRVAAYRLRALLAEQRANELSNPTLRQEWEELAIEWHLLANSAAQAPDDDIQQVEAG